MKKHKIPIHLRDLKPVEQKDIDHAKICQRLDDWRLDRIGFDHASAMKGKQFYLFKCPHCHRIFLGDDETRTIYYDADYFGQYIFEGHFHQCVDCGYAFSGFIYGGEKVSSLFIPSLKEIKYSPWHWCLLDDMIY